MKREDFKPGVVFRWKDSSGTVYSKVHYQLGEHGVVIKISSDLDLRIYLGKAVPTLNNKGFNLSMFAITHMTAAFVKFSDLEVVS